MKKEAVLIYPYDSNFTPFLRHRSLMNYEIIGVVSPNGWGFCGKDACVADGGEKTGIIVQNSFDNLIDKCDTLIIASSLIKLNFDKVIYPIIEKAIKLKKNIISTIDINTDIKQKIIQACEKNNSYFKDLSYNPIEIKKQYDIDSFMLHRFKTPIVFILGITERTNKFEIQLSLREQLQKVGYKVSQIGSRHYCEIVGFHSFPAFMFSASITEAEKIILFNHFVKLIERDENPDLIVIGIPGGVMPVSQNITCNFGITAFEVSNALLPDAVIFSTIYEDFDLTHLKNIQQSIKYKFGFEIDFINISNTKIDWERSNHDKALKYITVNTSLMDLTNFVNTTEKPVFNILNEHDGVKLSRYLVEILAKYAETSYL